MYHHKSGALKRKERKQRQEKEKKMKKKEVIKQFFKKPVPKEDEVEENVSVGADVEEENPCTSRTLSTESTEHEIRVEEHLDIRTQKSIPGQGPNSDIQSPMERETEKFASLLERMLKVTLFLASRNLEFRENMEFGESSEEMEFGESSQAIGDSDNGNLFGLLELISHYDPLLQEHFEIVKHSEKTGDKLQDRYLTFTTQNELVKLCGKRVLDTILAERKKAIYFSVICDTIPDVSKTPQNVVMVRYVHRNSETGLWGIQERFIEYYECFNKSNDEVAEILLSKLNKHGLDVNDCRGQGYYNGANRFDNIKGVSDHIEEKYPAAIFCPCAVGSLNIVGVNAASCSIDVGLFFASVNRLFKFLSSCPDGWDVLREETGCSLHNIQDTIWSARIEAIRPLAEKLPQVIEALYTLMESERLPYMGHYDADSSIDYFLNFRSVLLAILWAKILQPFEEKNKILQSKSISLEIGATNLKALSAEMQSLREKWDEVLSEAELVADNLEIPKDLKPQYKFLQKSQPVDNEEDAVMSFKQNVFLVVLDSIIAELNKCFQSMENISGLFAPLLKMRVMSEQELVTSTEALVSKYPLDLTPSLLDELKLLRKVYDATFENGLEPLELLNAIFRLQIEPVFPEVCIALRIFAALPLSVVEGEYEDTKQTLAKSYLGSTISEQQMENLAFLSIEYELARQLDFKDLFQDFASAKMIMWSAIEEK